ncbi:MAG: hypothetical protein HY222_04030 [Thaumarchaeota archaeon]|nr:hypothetical protein [Nitrososphaerota archaeon]MBI3641544.1 hypothetical protein [Nitrososphaerota archaeon]
MQKHKRPFAFLEPMDIISYKNSGIVDLVNSTVSSLNITSKVIGYYAQITGEYGPCDATITLERMLNTNDRYADRSIHYTMESFGNLTSITIFTHKTPIGGLSDATLRNTVMTSCFGLGERFPHMYGTQNDYESIVCVIHIKT